MKVSNGEHVYPGDSVMIIGDETETVAIYMGYGTGGCMLKPRAKARINPSMLKKVSKPVAQGLSEVDPDDRQRVQEIVDKAKADIKTSELDEARAKPEDEPPGSGDISIDDVLRG